MMLLVIVLCVCVCEKVYPFLWHGVTQVLVSCHNSYDKFLLHNRNWISSMKTII